MNARLEEARKQRLAHKRKDNLLRFILKCANLDREQNLEVIKILFPEMRLATHEYTSHCCDGDLASLVGDLFSMKFMGIEVKGYFESGYRPAGGEG